MSQQEREGSIEWHGSHGRDLEATTRRKYCALSEAACHSHERMVKGMHSRCSEWLVLGAVQCMSVGSIVRTERPVHTGQSVCRHQHLQRAA